MSTAAYHDEIAWALVGECPTGDTIEEALAWADMVKALDASEQRVAREVTKLVALLRRFRGFPDDNLVASVYDDPTLNPGEKERIVSFARLEALCF